MAAARPIVRQNTPAHVTTERRVRQSGQLLSVLRTQVGFNLSDSCHYANSHGKTNGKSTESQPRLLAGFQDRSKEIQDFNNGSAERHSRPPMCPVDTKCEFRLDPVAMHARHTLPRGRTPRDGTQRQADPIGYGEALRR